MMFSSLFFSWKHCREDNYKALSSKLSINSSERAPRVCSHTHAMLQKHCMGVAALRSFSGLKRIKTALRSTMSTEHLSSLALLHMHQDIPVNIEEVIDEFSRRHPRRF